MKSIITSVTLYGLILILGLIPSLPITTPLNVFSTSDEDEDEDTDDESRDEDEDTTEPSFPESAYKPDITDKALSLFTTGRINNTEYAMILCAVILGRPDASAGGLVDCHSLFDNDETIGNENQTLFYENINKTVTNLLAR
jgi:hypothetical protein